MNMDFRTIAGPLCHKCQISMKWVSEQIVENKPMQVFHCKDCDKYSAALPGTNGQKTTLAPALVTGM